MPLQGLSTKQAWGMGPPCSLDPCPGLAALLPAALGGDGAEGPVRLRKSWKSSSPGTGRLLPPRECCASGCECVGWRTDMATWLGIGILRIKKELV